MGSFYPYSKSSAFGGFTLIEMLIVVGIILLISSTVIVGQGPFNRTVTLANTAYDVALSLQNAQTYGIASRVTSSASNAGYGIEFNGNARNSYLFFADTDPPATCGTPLCKPGDGLFTSGSDLTIQTYNLNNGITLQNMCATDAVRGTYCLSGGSGTITKLDVVFTRPNTSATIRAADKNGVWFITQWQSACLSLTSPTGNTRAVKVTQIGQVTTALSCS